MYTKNNLSDLFCAILTKDVDAVRSILEKNQGLVHAKDCNQGDTPLHVATQSAPTEVIDLLIKTGSDVNARNDKLNTPLHYAVIWQNPDAIKLLLTHGADIQAKNGKDQTAEDCAVIACNTFKDSGSFNPEAIAKLLKEARLKKAEKETDSRHRQNLARLDSLLKHKKNRRTL